MVLALWKAFVKVSVLYKGSSAISLRSLVMDEDCMRPATGLDKCIAFPSMP